MIDIQIKSSDMKKLRQCLGDIKNGVPRALAPAINTALATGRAQLKREIRKEYTIKAKDIPIALHRASYTHLAGDVRIDQGMLPLDRFELHPRGFLKHKKPIFARVKKGKGGLLRHAFFTPGGGPFKRLGPERYPIVRLVTISAAIMASQPTVAPAVNNAMELTLTKRIDHEIDRVMATAGRK
jgi:hypothetical protein